MKSTASEPGLIRKRTKGVVSKETVALCWWGRRTQEFGFINGVANVN